MPNWLLKAAGVRVLSALPRGEALAALARRHVTKSLVLPKNVSEGKADRAAIHLRNFLTHRKLAALPPGFTALELGTGWFPVAPVAAALLGAEHVYTVDLTSHLGWPEVETTLRRVREIAIDGEWLKLPPGQLPRIDKALAAGTVDGALSSLGIERIVGDAGTLALKRPVDVFFSNNTLEHIPPPTLLDMLRHFRTLASPRAVMSHWIDMSDHYAEFDRTIGPYNFLQYSAPVFALANGSLHYQNRLRHTDFLRLHESAGWRVVKDEPTRGTPEELAGLSLAPEFSTYARDDLLVYEAWVVSEPLSSS